MPEPQKTPERRYAVATIDPPKVLTRHPLGGAAKKWPAAEVGPLLEKICRQVIERGSDPVIEASFAEALQSGALSVRDVVHSLALSDLYMEKYAAPGNPREAVQHAFRRLLAREAEPGGLSHWTPICQKQGLNVVLHGQITSGEYGQRFGLDLVPFAPPKHEESLFWRVVKAGAKLALNYVAKK
jgi:hypothetical protein